MNSIINNNKNKRKLFTYVIILPCYVSYRMYWSNRLPIMDCDEVYNYWEPLHYLQYNIGLQTWEYASSYALRTYMYLYPLHYFQKYILLSSSRIQSSSFSSLSSLLVDYDVVVGSSTKMESFLWMRSILGGLMGLSEVMFVSSLCYEIPFKDFIPSSSSKRLVSTTSSVCIGFVLLTSTGMCHASSAFLPSSTIMMMWLWCATAYTYRYYTLFCIIAITATLGVGWPFGVIVFIPMGLHILQIKYYQNEFYRFMLRIILLTILIQSMVMYIDYVNYGKVLSSTYNIFRYNAQQKGNDDLYGIEPLSYYIKNLFLNFNYISWIAFLGFWPISMYLKKKSNNNKRRRRRWSAPLLLMIGMPLYVWMTIVGKRPHKEERFLYPIYPSICVAAVVVIEQIGIWILEYYYIPTATTDSSEKRTITKTNSNHTSTTITTTTTMTTPTSPLQQSKHGLLLLRIWMLLWILPSCILSYSRVVALSKYYTAPTYIYSRLPSTTSSSTTTTTEEKKKKVVVCTCGEWYRFPSSYYLDEDTMILGFVESSFRGQLPKYFIPNVGSKGGTNFNDRNRYVDDDERIIPLSNLQKDCDYVIDLIEYDKDDNELCGTSMITKNWKLIAKAPFLNARATSTLHRTIYLPFGYHRGVYDQYVLFGKE